MAKEIAQAPVKVKNNGSFVGGIVLTCLATVGCLVSILFYSSVYELMNAEVNNVGEATGEVFGLLILLPLWIIIDVIAAILAIVGLILALVTLKKYSKKAGLPLLIINGVFLLTLIGLFVSLQLNGNTDTEEAAALINVVSTISNI